MDDKATIAMVDADAIDIGRYITPTINATTRRVEPPLVIVQLMLASEIQQRLDTLLPSPKIWMASGNMLPIG